MRGHSPVCCHARSRRQALIREAPPEGRLSHPSPVASTCSTASRHCRSSVRDRPIRSLPDSCSATRAHCWSDRRGPVIVQWYRIFFSPASDPQRSIARRRQSSLERARSVPVDTKHRPLAMTLSGRLATHHPAQECDAFHLDVASMRRISRSGWSLERPFPQTSAARPPSQTLIQEETLRLRDRLTDRPRRPCQLSPRGASMRQRGFACRIIAASR